MVKVKRSILEFFPYPDTIRPQQKEALLAIETHWNKYDNFVVVAPTACGKSPIALTLAKWRYNAAIITPTNLLVQQFITDFPHMQKLFKRELYPCTRFANGYMNCAEAAAKYKKKLGCNLGCQYQKDNRAVRGRGNFIANYYTYMANKLYKPVLIVDEAHNLVKMLQDLAGQRIWRHEYNYPWDMWTHADILHWIETIDKSSFSVDAITVLQILKNEITSQRPRYVIKRGYDTWRGEDKELLTMLPVDVRDAPPFLWPPQVQKIVLMSATMSHKDIENLGLDRRRTLYLEVDSPIPSNNRPIIVDFIANVNRNNLDFSTKLMAKKIIEYYLPKYEGKKGLIHATYAQAKILKEFLDDNIRFIFHDKTNTKQKYQEFLNAPIESGKVFVASGLYEGVDLADDFGRFQIITKIPWLNLGDPAIKYKAEEDESWFVWEALKSTCQATGRIARNPTDFGETIIMDGSFERLIRLGYQFELIPGWWRDALPEQYKGGI